jgi:lipopolysaccharide/colanic/teichoic acid biosynthesis glycosyltransferase
LHTSDSTTNNVALSEAIPAPYPLGKRLFDLTGAAAALVVLSPLLVFLAALIRLTSSGPILYRQTRCGRGGRLFTLYKFRSMVVDADKLRQQVEPLNQLDGPAFKLANDPRCAPLGRFLRKYSLDELPQFWNILRGEMSLVGPRAPLPEEVEKYEPWQFRRLTVIPGLTCLWVLEGRNDLPFNRWVELDLAYIDNWSLWLDLKILLKTVPLVLSGRGAS